VLMLALRERLAFAGISQERERGNGAGDDRTHARRQYPDRGVLVSMSAEQTRMDLVQVAWTDVRLLMMARNRLAAYSKEADGGKVSSLPPMIRRPNECQHCYQAAECVAHHATAEHGSAASSGVDELYQYLLRNTNSDHLSYLMHWNTLIDLEARATKTTQYSVSDQSTNGTRTKGEAGSKGLRELQMQSILETGDGFELVLAAGHPTATANSSNGGITTAANVPLLPLPLSRSLSEGEKVYVSVERRAVGSLEVMRDRQSVHTRPPNVPKEIADIESLATGRPGHGASSYDGSGDTISRLFGPASESLMSVEPNVSSGVISSISETEVRVIVPEKPRRLLSLFNEANGSGKGQRSVRLEKDEFSSNVSISTMRSNLLALFLEPHNPTMYKAHVEETKNNRDSQHLNRNKSKVGHSSNGRHGSNTLAYQSSAPPPVSSPTPVAMDPSWHWRRLIVDLQKPVFRPPRAVPPPSPSEADFVALSDDLILFAPLDMPLVAYRAALRMLQTAMGCAADASQSRIHDKERKMLVVGTLCVYPGCNPFDLLREFNLLNSGQREAVRKILSAQDYALLLGLPGTGKTSAIALVVRAMVARQQRVLLTSYTHSAVDNLVVRLLQSGMQARQVVRIGTAQSVHPAAQALLLSAKQCENVSALASHVDAARVVASTVLAASRHAFLKQLRLDCCVMDEAGQIAQPVALGAVVLAKTLVLVGDDYQVSTSC
jgi:hypothetical protein